MSTSYDTSQQGLRLFEYGSGTNHLIDFSTGTHNGTVENAGDLELGGILDDWWDVAWKRRQCFTVDASDAKAEYPLRFEVDTTGSGSDGDDIRVVEGTTGTQLDSYSEGPFEDASSIVWAQAEPLPAGSSSYCVYFQNSSAVDISSEVDVFTYTSGQKTSYYTMLDTYNNTALQVVSYANNNEVSDGTTTVMLNAGQQHTFLGTDRNTVITATGPIEGSADVNGTETIIPEGYASNEFVFAVTRGTNGAWVRSPHVTTTIEAYVNGVVANSVTIGPADGSVYLQADFGSDDTMILRSNDGTDFVALFKSTSTNDVGPGVPWFGDTLYGVRSRWIWVGAMASTVVQLEGSDGTSLSLTVSNLASQNISDATDLYGNGTAFSAESGGGAISAYQYADGNGGEITAFMPRRLLSETYILPTNANYFTIACPTNPTNVTYGGTTYSCSSTNAAAPGFLYSGLSFFPAGTTVTADNPIFVYNEVDIRVDEHNLLGVRGSIPYLEKHVITSTAVELLEGFCGTWTSPVMASSGVFGTFSESTVLPAGTSAEFQLSTDGSAFYGPDGTSATSFADGDIIPYLADNSTTVQIQVELCTKDPLVTPTVESLSVECDLTEVVTDVSNVATIAVNSPDALDTTHLLRVYQEAAGTWDANVSYTSGSNLPPTDADFSTDTPTLQVSALSGSVSSPSPTFTHSSAQPYTLSATHKTSPGQTTSIELLLADENTVKLETAIAFDFIG